MFTVWQLDCTFVLPDSSSQASRRGINGISVEVSLILSNLGLWSAFWRNFGFLRIFSMKKSHLILACSWAAARFCSVLLGSCSVLARFCSVLARFLLGSARFCSVLLGSARFLLGSARFYSVLLGSFFACRLPLSFLGCFLHVCSLFCCFASKKHQRRPRQPILPTSATLAPNWSKNP